MLSVLCPDTGGRIPDLPIPIALAHPRDPPVACGAETESWPCPGGEILVVRISGEVDMLTLPLVAATLGEAMSRAPGHLVVDLAATTFCCVRGVELFAETASDASARGVGFALSGLTAHHCRIVDLVLRRPGPVRYRSVAAALTTIFAAHAHPPAG